MSDAENDLGQEPDANENNDPASVEARNDTGADALEYSSAVHINSPLDRSLRNNTAELAATFDPEGVATDSNGKIKDALAAAAQITDENERLPHKTQFSSGDHAKRIAQIRKKRIPQTSIAKELSRMPPNKSDAETGLEVGKHTWRGLIAGVMSARKDAEAKRDAKLAEELEDARQAQKELDRREKDDADSQDKAKQTVTSKADARGKDDAGDPDAGGSGGNGGPGGGTPGNAKSGASTGDIAKAPTSGGLGSIATPIIDTAKEVAKTVAPAATAIAMGVPPEAAMKSISDAVKTTSKILQGTDLQVTPPAKSLASANQTGALFDQARSLARVSEPVRSIGPENPAPRVRAQGMGLGFASLIKAARALAPKEPGDISAAAWMQKRRDTDGLSR